MNSIQWLLITISLFKNWPSIYIKKLTHKKISLLKLYSGPIFHVDQVTTTLPTIVEVFKDKVYGDLDFLRKMDSPVLIDVGANIGAFSIFAKTVNPSVKVYAFEPEIKNFTDLEKNLKMNGVDAVAVNEGVGDMEGTRTLYLTGEQSGTNSLFGLKKWKYTQEIEVTTLDKIFSTYNITHCDLLKLDCEGAEFEILERTPPETLTKIDSILLEWHPVPGKNNETIKTILLRSGFKVTTDEEHCYLVASRISGKSAH